MPDDLTLGYLSHTADVVKVSSTTLELRCQQPVRTQEFTVTGMQQNELRLPKAGSGCQIAIKALTSNGTRFVQDHDTSYDWSKDSIVELFGQLNNKHLVRVQIEQQLPERLSADKHTNSFLFKVIKLQDGDRIINTSEGIPLISEVRGLALTTWIATNTQLVPIFARQPGSNPYLPTKQVRFAFSCSYEPGRATIFEDKLICDGDMFHELSFAMVSGTINPDLARQSDICNTQPMTALPLHNTVISLPQTGMPQHMSALTTIVLRSKQLDKESGEFRQSCHLYPLAPHLAPWTDGYRPHHTL